MPATASAAPPGPPSPSSRYPLRSTTQEVAGALSHQPPDRAARRGLQVAQTATAINGVYFLVSNANGHVRSTPNKEVST